MVGVVVVALLAFVIVKIVKARQGRLPEGIASGNGRLEATLVDVSAREPLRVDAVLVNEGDMVKPGEVLVRLDTTTLQAQLDQATAQVAAATERMTGAEATVRKAKEQIALAQTEVRRSEHLVAQGAGSQRELDVRRTNLQTTTASLAEAEAGVQTARKDVDAAQANAREAQSRLNDATLRATVYGRVLYRLAEPGEVLAPGGKAITLVNVRDVYMEIFLPSNQAAALKIGAEGRITVDYDPKHAIPGFVSFVSPEAQFTPKQVETRTEREKLMFRVKIQVPEELASQYIERIKTGVRGMGYVKIDEHAVWPDRLQNLPPPAPPLTKK